MKCCGGVGYVPGRKWFDFGADPVSVVDSGLLFGIVNHYVHSPGGSSVLSGGLRSLIASG